MSETITIPEISDIEIAFGTTTGLPKYAAIPAEFKRHNGTKWNELFSKWFYGGLKSLKVAPKEGIDKNAALRHVKACMASWEPKAEHKEAGVAYLMSQYFADAEWS